MIIDDTALEALSTLSGYSVGKTLGMVIRPTFVAPKGKTLVWGDWSAIEARVCPWLAASPGAERKLDIFRRNDADPSLPDVYKVTAGEMLSKDPYEIDKKERQSHGKVPELSLQFGGADGALMKMAVNYHVHLESEVAKWMVKTWRERNPWAKEFWGYYRLDKHGNLDGYGGLWGAANMAIRNPGNAYPAGRVAYVFDPDYLDGTLFCALPCGRVLTYPDCKWRERKIKDKATGDEEMKAALWFRKGYGWSALWHGKLAENVTQAVAGSILRETLVQLDPDYSTYPPIMLRGDWMPVVGHTHDEVVIEVDERDGEEAGGVLEHVMSTPTEWRLDLPLVAEVTENWFYTKTEEQYL
jgi:DNA polymerase